MFPPREQFLPGMLSQYQKDQCQSTERLLTKMPSEESLDFQKNFPSFQSEFLTHVKRVDWHQSEDIEGKVHVSFCPFTHCIPEQRYGRWRSKATRPLGGCWSMLYFPLEKVLTDSKKGWLKVLTKIVPHICKCVGGMLVVTVTGQVGWQGISFWNLVG